MVKQRIPVEGKGWAFISNKVFSKTFRRSQFPQKIVNVFFISAIVKDKLTDFCGNRLLQNDFLNTFCEIRLHVDVDVSREDA